MAVSKRTLGNTILSTTLCTRKMSGKVMTAHEMRVMRLCER